MSAPTQLIKEDEAKKKKKGMLITILFILILGGVGGAAYYKLVIAEAVENVKEQGTKHKRGKKSRRATKEKDETNNKDGKREEEEFIEIEYLDDTKVKEVLELQPFIINLADQDEIRYLRLSISVGLGESKGDHKPDLLFTTRIRSAMLAVLATKRSDEIRTSEGKAKLRKQLLEVAQSASEEPPIQAIYITDFIIQL